LKDNVQCNSPFYLYIPHGSDERRVFDCFCKIVYVLYIPHGSDESDNANNADNADKLDFISHMVQMKVTLLPSSLISIYAFISHMVQMKVDNLAKAVKDALNFISHMVQMKETIRKIRDGIDKILYIPHGSDERF